jgi:MtrB/PioB family decaheme-associated outer membrane protein
MAMNRKTLCSVLSGALLVIPAATSYAEEGEPAEKATADVEKERFIIHGDVTMGAQSVEQNNNSSKFNEYKDDETDLYLYRLNVGVDDTETGQYFGFRGSRLSRDDQEMLLEFGMAGRFSLDFSLNETPHLLSNNAKTPYDYLGGGTYRVADGIVNSIQISNVNNASSWTAADAGPGGAGEDFRINKVLNNSVHNINLGTLRRDGTLELSYYLTDRTTAKLEFGSSTKDGSIVTGTSIGDRPPRSLVAQLPEPIDYKTDDIKLSLAFNGDSYQVDTTYQYSRFENSNDALTWNSLFHAPGFFNSAAVNDDYDDIRQGFGTSYATTGKIALSPDNTYHNLMVNAGFNLPWASRLTASLAMGKMLQDETLLPYATTDFGGTLLSLPRTSADAEIGTKMLNLAYNINPISKLNAKLHYRYYDLNNDTPQSQFKYNTQDTDSNGYLNERINLGYGYTQNNYGLDLSYYLGKMGTLGFAYENDKKDRDFREVAETDEDSFKLSYRVSPIDKVSVNAKYTKAKRDGSPYNSEITDLSYYYDTTVNQAQSNNPLMGFGNAPGLRKYDVTDRERDDFSLGVGFVPTDTVNVNMSYRNTKNDYASDIASTITTWDSVALAFVTVPVDPTQLGLLENKASTYALDLSFTPVETLTFTGYLSREKLDSKQRGRYLDEDNRINNITGTKDWQDTTGAYLWNTDFTDTTNTLGIGAKYAINNKYDIGADFTHSRGTVDIKYSAGDHIAEEDILNPPDSHAWAEWSSPDEVEFRTNTFTLDVTRHVAKSLKVGFKYMYQKYEVTDWQQAASGAHQNPLGDYYVADNDPETAGTSQDRAGSRLVRLSDYPAPDYHVNVFYVTVGYSW